MLVKASSRVRNGGDRGRQWGAVLAALALVLAGCAGSFTSPASAITDTSATISGLVFDPVDATVPYWFEYGPTAAYGAETTHRTITIDDRDNHPVSENLTGLTPGTTYHYRLCAEKPLLLCGGDETFTTTGGVNELSIGADPALYPAFDPTVSDYVTRCGTGPVSVDVAAPAATTVSIDGSLPRNGPFSQTVPLSEGQGFEFSTSTSGQTDVFHVRCLPDDFPDWTYSRPGQPAADFYITTPRNVATPEGQSADEYIAIYDDNGVPVWWQQQTGGIDAQLLPDGSLAWGISSFFGNSPRYERHLLDGSLAQTWTTVGFNTDVHDLQLLPNGNVLVGAYVPRPGTLDLSAYGGPSTNGTLSDAVFQEVTPEGSVVWSWSSEDHIDPSETPERWRDSWVYALPGELPDGRQVFDYVHWNSIQQVGDTVVMSFRHLDAVLAIDKTSGDVVWKLGGTPTPESLTVVGDPESNPLGGQHHARLQPDGTVTIYDNNTNETAAPRGVKYQIDVTDDTATMLNSVSDPDVATSPCCGSATELTDGSWVMSWGGTPTVSEFGPNGERHFVLTFATEPGAFGFSYRVEPIEGGVTVGALRTGMDAKLGA